MKDPRERHVVCKLDRYELEDRYLRLLEEVNSLKKLTNNQEDKIKRLATKLMRFGANPRACITAIDVTDDRDKLALLEAENSKLRDKVCVLRNQLVNQRIFGRSPSRGRRHPIGSTSGPITCRSESSRLKAPSCQCINPRSGNDENDVQNYFLKTQEMEAEKKDMLSRIAELELELASFTSGNRREKVAENVEYIRVWRQMKRLNEKLVVAQSTNEILNDQISQLKNHLDETLRNNKQMKAELAAERKQVAELDGSTSKVKDLETEIKERDQIIQDLNNEMEILQQHNRELLDLSSKFGKVEEENAKLKRKGFDQLAEQQSLRDELSKEKANILALQAANDQLLAKLHELQKNIDVMTVQLMAQNEKHNKSSPRKKSPSKSTQSLSSEERSSSNRESSQESLESCKKCCDIRRRKKSSNLSEKGIQTSERLEMISETTQTDIKPLDSSAKLTSENNMAVDKNLNKKSKSVAQLPQNNGNSLSREGMLKLLEQVQISTPLESQSATMRMRHNNDASSTTLPVRVPRQASNLETLLFGDSAF